MIAKYKQIEESLTSDKDGKGKQLESERISLFKRIKVKIGLSVPGLPVNIDASVEYEARQEVPPRNK